MPAHFAHIAAFYLARYQEYGSIDDQVRCRRYHNLSVDDLWMDEWYPSR